MGRRTKCKVVKNKVAPPFKSCEFDMIYGQGISKMGEIIDMGVELGIIKKSGSWFSYENMKIGQGRESVKKWLLENSDISDEVEGKIRARADELFKLMAGESPEENPDGNGGSSDSGNEEGEGKPAEAAAKKPAKETKKSAKKAAVVEAEADFEEFSIEDMDD